MTEASQTEGAAGRLARIASPFAADMGRAFGPGLAIATLCGASVFALVPVLGEVPTGRALLVHIAAGAAIWALCMAAAMRARILVLPTP
mgnify:FL=1